MIHNHYNIYSKTLLLCALTALAILGLALSPAYAQQSSDFTITNNFEIYYKDGDDFVTVEEELIIRANNPKYYLPAQDQQIIELSDFLPKKDATERAYKLSNLTVKDQFGNEKNYTHKETENGIELSVEDGRTVSVSADYILRISYRTHELIDRNGNIVNLYIPGLSPSIEFDTEDDRYGVTSQYIFNTSLNVPASVPEASYVKPTSIEVGGNSNTRTYSISQDQRKGTSSWIQLGTRQYYYFRIEQEAKMTDKLIPQQISDLSSYLSTNIYTLPLPKEDDENNQRVFISKIDPAPKTIERDSEGNLKAYFEIPANRDSTIIIEGYLTLESSKKSLQDIPNLTYQEYMDLVTTQDGLNSYTKPDIYWESDNPQVEEIAQDILAKNNTILDIIKADYQYVIDTFDYSYEKIEDNERLGALAALNGAPAVCMEYADATIAILRAQGIPARAVVGYGNDPTGAENLIGQEKAEPQNIGHQWLQVWVPDYGWLSVDPTWGESGREYIGANLDHLLWYTLGSSDDSFLGTSLNSADAQASNSLQAYDIYLQSLSEEDFAAVGQLEELDQLLQTYGNESYSDIDLVLKTTAIGKAVIIIAPLFISFALIVTVVTIAMAMRKRYRYKKALSQQVARRS